jgi:hypothetical protein
VLVKSIELGSHHQHPNDQLAPVEPLVLRGVNGQQHDQSVEDDRYKLGRHREGPDDGDGQQQYEGHCEEGVVEQVDDCGEEGVFPEEGGGEEEVVLNGVRLVAPVEEVDVEEEG